MQEKRAGERLRDWRVEYGYKVREIAELLQIHTNHFHALQSGRRRPGRELAVRIEKATGIPVGDW